MTSTDIASLGLRIASKSNMEHQYACIIVYRAQIIASGFNHHTCNCYSHKNTLNPPCIL
ncbi:hypothetical protein BMW23_0850 [Bodo saltans virus]|uniref:Uncharacterized protein n=1 Tax=Bodo saltans virus TaxID=2024608 RepID=A0A2H4UVL3_9VIRU|nr:hypothetical protein QJ851_gp0833 [Bodo saltans virus]ATZ80896.1 hypothetical protein BMW23_0850 [Bodo saltans virus]